MRAIGLIIAQIVISFTLAALAMPAILHKVPAARGRIVGPTVALGIIAALFVVLRVIWPRQRTN